MFAANKDRYEEQLLEPALAFVDEYVRLCQAAAPLMRFLCDALAAPY